MERGSGRFPCVGTLKLVMEIQIPGFGMSMFQISMLCVNIVDCEKNLFSATVLEFSILLTTRQLAPCHRSLPMQWLVP